MHHHQPSNQPTPIRAHTHETKRDTRIFFRRYVYCFLLFFASWTITNTIKYNEKSLCAFGRGYHAREGPRTLRNPTMTPFVRCHLSTVPNSHLLALAEAILRSLSVPLSAERRSTATAAATAAAATTCGGRGAPVWWPHQRRTHNMPDVERRNGEGGDSRCLLVERTCSLWRHLAVQNRRYFFYRQRALHYRPR